ncbi:MAG: DUF4897 domain-containing protein [Chloroflexota bacterium]
MPKAFLAVLGILLLLGGYSAWEFRGKMSDARLGSDVTYTIDAQGNAAVEMVNKSFFMDESTEKNFDGMVARLGKPDGEAYRKGVEESLKKLSEKTGRQFVVSDFEASFERHADYGAQVYRFRWSGFAEQRNGAWVVDFKAASAVKLNKDSSLAVVLPQGAAMVRAEPAPTGGDGAAKMVWTGTGEIPWPFIEYRR